MALKQARRRDRQKRRQEVTKLKEEKEKLELDYRHELEYRAREKTTFFQKFEAQERDMKELKQANNDLRQKAKLLRITLKAKENELSRMVHFFCDICFEQEKSKTTTCGHGFCEACLAKWQATASRETQLIGNGVSVLTVFSCPSCRQKLNPASDVWPIYLSKA